MFTERGGGRNTPTENDQGIAAKTGQSQSDLAERGRMRLEQESAKARRSNFGGGPSQSEIREAATEAYMAAHYSREESAPSQPEDNELREGGYWGEARTKLMREHGPEYAERAARAREFRSKPQSSALEATPVPNGGPPTKPNRKGGGFWHHVKERISPSKETVGKGAAVVVRGMSNVGWSALGGKENTTTTSGIREIYETKTLKSAEHLKEELAKGWVISASGKGGTIVLRRSTGIKVPYRETQTVRLEPSLLTSHRIVKTQEEVLQGSEWKPTKNETVMTENPRVLPPIVRQRLPLREAANIPPQTLRETRRVRTLIRPPVKARLTRPVKANLTKAQVTQIASAAATQVIRQQRTMAAPVMQVRQLSPYEADIRRSLGVAYIQRQGGILNWTGAPRSGSVGRVISGRPAMSQRALAGVFGYGYSGYSRPNRSLLGNLSLSPLMRASLMPRRAAAIQTPTPQGVSMKPRIVIRQVTVPRRRPLFTWF